MEELEKVKAENEKLKNIIADKSELISISAHQLRTSLSALKWILKMLVNKDLGKLSVEQESFIKKAYDSNERMIALVNKVLVLNNTGEKDIEPRLEKVDILKLAEQVLFEFSGETFNLGIEVILIKPDTGLPDINCDMEMIRIVLQNLIENAIKYSYPHGKIVMTIKHNESPDEIEISVHDNGIGINDYNKEKIFMKFFRGTNALKQGSTGSGLGLYTTKNIVEHHKGKIWFESVPEKGTTFYITLPIN